MPPNNNTERIPLSVRHFASGILLVVAGIVLLAKDLCQKIRIYFPRWLLEGSALLTRRSEALLPRHRLLHHNYQPFYSPRLSFTYSTASVSAIPNITLESPSSDESSDGSVYFEDIEVTPSMRDVIYARSHR